MMRFDVVTLFPELFSGYLEHGILNRAIRQGQVSVHLHDLRQWAEGKHRQVDDTPYGGGAGMVMMVEPVVKAVRQILSLEASETKNSQVVLLSPQGEPLKQTRVENLASGYQQIILLCGRYEGFDHRVVDILQPLELSIGDYVLNGGEVAAMVVVDSVMRLIPGVLGDQMSHVDDSFSSGNRILEYPQYTRPAKFEGYPVPPILLSGNHQAIEDWRREQSRARTANRRHDLIHPPKSPN